MTQTSVGKKTSGLYYLHGVLTVISSCAIVNSEGEGPKAGILVMGRPLTSDYLTGLSDKVKIKFAVDEATAAMPHDFAKAKHMTLRDVDGEMGSFYDVDENTIAGIVFLRDITHGASIRLIVYNDKDIVHRGYTILAKSSLVLIVGGLALFILMVIFVDRSIIRRLLSLKWQLATITEGYSKNNTVETVAISGKDELRQLAAQINFFIKESYGYKNHLEQLVTEKVLNLNNDIVKYQHTVTELREKNAALIEDGQARSGYFANATHEVRTPLNAIKGMADFLLKTNLDTEQLDCVKTIWEAGGHLSKVVDDILDLSKIEAKKVTFEHVEFNLFNLLHSTGKMLKPFADQKDIHFTTTFAGDKGAIIVSDPSKIRQILFNLAYNAIKFTATGGVTIATSVTEKKDSDRLGVEIRVIDTGIGMSEETIKRIFSPFVQGDASINRIYGGTGLGLVICKKLVELLGGHIHVQSQQQSGSTFTIMFEASRGSVDSLAEYHQFVPSEKLASFNILVVDDNVINLKVAAKLFSLLHQTPTCASSADQALEFLEKQPFDIVFTDIEMPSVDGYELTKIIRASSLLAVNHDIPIVAMTAYSMSFQKEHCFEIGINEVITKPIDLNKVQDVLLRFSSGALQQSEPGEAYEGGQGGSICRDDVMVLDAESALARLGGDKTLYLDVCIDFLDKFNAEKFAMTFLAVPGDPSDIRSYAHNLKGSAASVGAQRVETFANYVQNNAALPLPALLPVLQSIHAELLRVEAALDALFTEDAFFHIGD